MRLVETNRRSSFDSGKKLVERVCKLISLISPLVLTRVSNNDNTGIACIPRAINSMHSLPNASNCNATIRRVIVLFSSLNY